MRILMLSQFYPPIIGGEERHVRNLSRALVAAGHEVAVATIWHAGMAEFEQDAGVRVYRLRGTLARLEGLFSAASHRHAPPFPDPELTQALGRVVAIERPQIVHAHNWLVHSFLPLKRSSGAKLVLTVHDHSLLCPKKKLIRGENHCDGPGLVRCTSCAGAHYGLPKALVVGGANWLMGAIERSLVDMFIPVSRATAADNQLVERGLPIAVVPNFIPDDLVATADHADPRLHALPSGPFALFVGAFGRYKGVDILAEAYAGSEIAMPLVVIGYQTPEYPVQTTSFPPGMQIYRDWPHAAVIAATQRSQFCLVPSTWSDPCPTVAMEAMACGKPLIASAIGGLTDLVVSEQTGILVPPSDVSALRTAMQRLASDPAQCARMGAAALQHVRAFTASAVVARIESIYTALHEGHTAYAINTSG